MSKSGVELAASSMKYPTLATGLDVSRIVLRLLMAESMLIMVVVTSPDTEVGPRQEELGMRRSRIALVGVLGLVAVGVGVGISNNEGPSLSGTATTLCKETSTHHCSPASIVEGPGEAHWNNTSAVKFTNENSHDNGNYIAWWASNGAHTSTTFYFKVDPKTSKTLGFPCPVDHLFADNKGNANTVFTSVVPAPALEEDMTTLLAFARSGYQNSAYTEGWNNTGKIPRKDLAVGSNYSMATGQMNSESSGDNVVIYKGVRVLRVKNKSDTDDVVGHIQWQIWTPEMKSVINEAYINPQAELKIVLPCATDILLWNRPKNVWSSDYVDDVCTPGYQQTARECWVRPNLLVTRDL